MPRRRRSRKQDQANLVLALVIFALGLPVYVWSQMHPVLGVLTVLAEGGVGYACWRIAGPRARAARLLAREVESLNPYEFEHYIAAAFVKRGWKAHATQASVDQGADVVAVSPSGVRYVVQVKKYTSTVGNKAVQEVVASKPIYAAAHALVVTSGPGYTRAAQQLAQANSVTLWTLDDLRDLQSGRRVQGLSHT